MAEGWLRKFIGNCPDVGDHSYLKKQMLEEYPNIQQFDFGDMDKVGTPEWIGLQDFAIDLIKENMFSLPFRAVSYSYHAEGHDHLIIAREIDYIPGENVFKGSGIEIIGGIYKNNAFIPCHGFFNYAESKSKNAFAIYVGDSPIGAFQDREINQRNALVFAQALCALTCLLKASGVIVETTSAPHRLNAQREKKGRLPIYEIRTVKIIVAGKTYSSGGAASDRVSPRLHWRRGHLRTLPSGALTVIPPCLVGDVGNGCVGHAGYKVERANRCT
jgi:hypothetical protein